MLVHESHPASSDQTQILELIPSPWIPQQTVWHSGRQIMSSQDLFSAKVSVIQSKSESDWSRPGDTAGPQNQLSKPQAQCRLPVTVLDLHRARAWTDDPKRGAARAVAQIPVTSI